MLELFGLPRGDAPDQMYFRHTDGRELKAIEDHSERGHIVVSPMRHPMAVAQSWKNRGKPVLRDDREHLPLTEFFHNLLELRAPVHWLPLDTPKREEYLQALRAATGKELRTDWARVGPLPDACSFKPLLSAEITAIQNLMKHPLFGQLGYA